MKGMENKLLLYNCISTDVVGRNNLVAEPRKEL